MIGVYFSILALIGLLVQPYWVKTYRLRRWQRQFNLKQHTPVFHELFKSIDGFALSRRARLHHDAMEYTYGEIEFTSFIALIAMTHPKPTTRFYDLGSGTGKAVIACAMVFDMQYYCGIERFNALHAQALKQQDALLQRPDYKEQAKKIHFVHTDFLNADLHQATLIFINATALFGPTWEQLNQKISREAPNDAVIITSSKPLSSDTFTVTHTTKVSMSWGIVEVHINKRYPLQDINTNSTRTV